MESEHPEVGQTSGQPGVRIGKAHYELDYFIDKTIHDSNGLHLGHVIQVIDIRSYLGLYVSLLPSFHRQQPMEKRIIIPIDQIASVANNGLQLRCSLDKLVTLPSYLEFNRELTDAPRKSNFAGYMKIEVQIPEYCLPFLMSIDDSPSRAITSLVITHRNAIAAARHNMPLSETTEEKDAGTEQRNVNYNRVLRDLRHFRKEPAWDQDNFDKLILSLMESMETREDIDELFSFLIAYGSEESNKPTAIQLKNRMSKQIAESNPEIWNQHLRKCKARLTISAKNLNLPKPFGKPYGKSPDRKHPIDEDLLRLLIPWVEGSNERCLISLDGQSHDESISILRDFTPPEFVLG